MRNAAKTLLTQIHIGRDSTRPVRCRGSAAAVPQWYGETIGFWDGEALITWTSNIQGWINHGACEFSNQLQSIEIYTPRKDASGKLTGINHEIVLYDPEASSSRSASCSPGTGSAGSTKANRYMSSSACRTSSRSRALPRR